MVKLLGVKNIHTRKKIEAEYEKSVEEDYVPEDAIIYCDSLVKIFKSDGVEVMALQGLDLSVKQGELMAVIGKSGSGKSTLLNMLGGLERPTAGRLYVDGHDLFAMKENDLVAYRKNTVGFVWQKSAKNLFPYMTALENVEAPMYFSKGREKERRKKAMSLLEMTGIEHKAYSYPREMSGGEQQRVAIAVALANDPKILLADEPTGAVDSKTSDMLQKLFHELNAKLGITIIIVTHDIKLANRVGRVVMISDGKISTEKIMKENYKKRLEESESFSTEESHEEYSVLDKAGRLQLNEELLAAAGIDTNMVKVSVEDGRIVITHRDSE
jgi:ABC-type lipoprotein export system ATPase subunit